MKILYSILSNAERMKTLNDSGIPDAKIKEIIDAHTKNSRMAPANFTFIPRESVEVRDTVRRKTAIAMAQKDKSKQMSSLTGVIIRKLKTRPNVKVDSEGYFVFHASVMAMMSRKLESLEPNKNTTERKKLISEMIRTERVRLDTEKVAQNQEARKVKLSTSRYERKIFGKSIKKSAVR